MSIPIEVGKLDLELVCDECGEELDCDTPYDDKHKIRVYVTEHSCYTEKIEELEELRGEKEGNNE